MPLWGGEGRGLVGRLERLSSIPPAEARFHLAREVAQRCVHPLSQLRLLGPGLPSLWDQRTELALRQLEGALHEVAEDAGQVLVDGEGESFPRELRVVAFRRVREQRVAP